MQTRPVTEFDITEWAFLVFGLVFAGVHLYLGAVAPGVPGRRASQFVVIGAAVAALMAVFLTVYWRPVLYLIAVIAVLYLGALWVLAGMEFFLYGLLAGVSAVLLVAVALYRFVRWLTGSRAGG